MTAVSTVKRALAAVLAVGALVVIGATLAGLTTVVISFGAGANPADAFTPAATSLAARSETVSWNPDEPGLLRTVERQTRSDVASAWAGAVSGEADDSWYAGGALERRRDTSSLDSAVDITWSEHRMTTYFYSLDGQVLGLEISSLGVTPTPSGALVPVAERYEVVMLLRDGNWRVERLTRL